MRKGGVCLAGKVMWGKGNVEIERCNEIANAR